MNKKGGTADIFVFVIAAFMIFVFSGLFIYIGYNMKSQLLLNPPSFVNASFYNQTVEGTIGKAADAVGMLRWLSYFLIVGMAISVLISAIVARSYPSFFFVYILIAIIAVLASVNIANSAEQLLQDPILGPTYLSIKANTIMLNLPTWAGVIAIIGAIIVFSNLGKNQQYYATS